MWYMFTMEYYSVRERNEIGSIVVMWIDLESVMQSKASQKKKSKHCVNVYVWNPERWSR